MAIVLIAGTQFPHHRRPTRRRHNPLHTKRSRTMGSDHRRHPWQAKRQRGSKLNTRVRVPPAARQRKPRSDRVLDTAGGPPGCSLRAWERSSFLARSPRATDRVLDALCHVQQQGLFTPWSEELQTDRQPRLMQSDRNG
jgi:hypothetical protein